MNIDELRTNLILNPFRTFIENKKCIWKTDLWCETVAHSFSEAGIEGILPK